jgi:hypothetical protein
METRKVALAVPKVSGVASVKAPRECSQCGRTFKTAYDTDECNECAASLDDEDE